MNHQLKYAQMVAQENNTGNKDINTSIHYGHPRVIVGNECEPDNTYIHIRRMEKKKKVVYIRFAPFCLEVSNITKDAVHVSVFSMTFHCAHGMHHTAMPDNGVMWLSHPYYSL